MTDDPIHKREPSSCPATCLEWLSRPTKPPPPSPETVQKREPSPSRATMSPLAEQTHEGIAVVSQGCAESILSGSPFCSHSKFPILLNVSPDFVMVSRRTPAYKFAKEDIWWRLAFVYVPINLEGESACHAPPKVVQVKITDDLREQEDYSQGHVTGGIEASSRLQWLKTSPPVLDRENGTHIPLGAVGYHIVAKYISVAQVGESGQPAYVVSERAVER